VIDQRGTRYSAPPKQTRNVRRSAMLAWVRNLAVLPILVLLFIIGGFVHESFFTLENIVSGILYQSSVLAVLVLAESLMLLSNRFDISIESVVGVAPAAAIWLMMPTAQGGSGIGLNVAAGIVLLIAIGAVIGLINGLLVVKLGLNTFMITLAMLILLRGITLGILKGAMIFNLPPAILFVGGAEVLGIPVAVCISIGLFIVAGLFLRYHHLGKAIYAIGGNQEAARAGGVRVERLRLGLYILAGTLAAFAGLMLTGRVATVLPSQGAGMVFGVFAAAVIGGVSLNGGRGSMLGAYLGVLLIGTVQNILTLSGISSFWIDAIFGGIIIAAVVISKYTAKTR
jgi:simple sugar transport system permease protein